MEELIQVSHLYKDFKGVQAVNDLSFTVRKGEIYGFLGQNGAGKSTTIRMLLTLVKPTAGDIYLFGKDIRVHREEILRQVGAVIEKPDLYQFLSAYENIELFARLSGTKVERTQILKQLEMVGLTERMHSRVSTFSQGMKQRLGLAVALVHDPRLVILDEPTNGLDPQGIADVRNLILDLSKHHGKTIFVSSHLLSEIQMLADRMLIIDKGKAVREGSINDLFDPSSMEVKMRVENPETVSGHIRLSKWSSILVSGGDAELFTFKMNKNDIAELTTFVVQHGGRIISVEPRHSLEKYFLSLTSENQHVATFKN